MAIDVGGGGVGRGGLEKALAVGGLAALLLAAGRRVSGLPFAKATFPLPPTLAGEADW